MSKVCSSISKCLACEMLRDLYKLLYFGGRLSVTPIFFPLPTMHPGRCLKIGKNITDCTPPWYGKGVAMVLLDGRNLVNFTGNSCPPFRLFPYDFTWNLLPQYYGRSLVVIKDQKYSTMMGNSMEMSA